MFVFCFVCLILRTWEVTKIIRRNGNTSKTKTFISLIRKHIYFLIISGLRKEGRKEMFYLTTHSTHFIYGYMASDLW